MWMMKLTTAIDKSPKFKLRVKRVGCSCCRASIAVADAYVDGKGFIWCCKCK